MTEDVPLDQCDVTDRDALAAYRARQAIWLRRLRTDDHHAIWPQIYSMTLGDLTFQTIAHVANADSESALHNPLISRSLIQGYAASQGLAIRRLVDRRRDVISLHRLLLDIKRHRSLLTREIYVSGDGLPYDTANALQRALEPGHAKRRAFGGF